MSRQDNESRAIYQIYGGHGGSGGPGHGNGGMGGSGGTGEGPTVIIDNKMYVVYTWVKDSKKFCAGG
ncbi:hypothetical protein DFH08DRAFT_954749 [Mycena albidolilacea]|uniref:Uncharacterized protein n=1 Tax=Mycena albidolilacea TaxID=1033008 RepID=A0AAD7ACK5_9AGAR|nr:hypothetical protein DFH08DRAFT_954749 [Mycena albidolilacea]